jgi:hypothetical protein
MDDEGASMSAPMCLINIHAGGVRNQSRSIIRLKSVVAHL